MTMYIVNVLLTYIEKVKLSFILMLKKLLSLDLFPDCRQ